jgi:tetratricopeptide (TPR) repeat protein
MSRSAQLRDSRVPETIVLRLDHAASPEERRAFVERIEPILPHLNWRAHFFIVSEGSPHEMEFVRQITDALALFLVENRFVTFHVHPLVRIGPPDRDGPARWKEILEVTRPFQQQAYEQQSEAQLSILPILEPAAGTADADWMRAAQFFLASSAKPSVLLREPAALERARKAAGQEIRFYIEPDRQSGADGLIRQLWINGVFEDLLERVKAGAEGIRLLLPCRTHRVIDQRRNEVYSCFHDWSVGRPFETLESISEAGARITGSCNSDACTACINRSLCSMRENLIANDSQAEGRRVHLQLALAVSDGGRHREAIEHAARARDLASLDTDRADASILEGLCHLGLREFQEAERALAEAAGSATDPGLVAFHRGRVQFEWRDYIEALERFEEALASGSEAVPEVDLLYYMAVSHVHIHEYPEARSYLDRWRRTGQRRALMLYYHGLCDIGEAKYESALSELRACEEAGPVREDMGNVLFYTGLCLKELGRYEEAIPVLERAAELDSSESGVFNLLGFCFYKTARHARAVDCFKRAIELDPRSAIDYANLATNLKELGRTEEAIAIYRKALSLDPNIGFARDNLRRLTGEPDERG